MNCSTHNESIAIAQCVHCGIGLCSACRQASASGRSVCGSECARKSEELEHALRSALAKTLSANKTSGWVSAVAGGASLLVGLLSIPLKMTVLAIYLLPVGLIFIFAAWRYFRNSRAVADQAHARDVGGARA
jgi:hypothetical protein